MRDYLNEIQAAATALQDARSLVESHTHHRMKLIKEAAASGNYTHQQIADAAGVTRSWVSQLLMP